MCVIARVLVVGFIFFVNPVVSHSGEIEFRDGDLFVGIANLGTSTRGNSHQLSRGFYSRNLVGVTSNSISLAESRSTLLFSPVGMTARMRFVPPLINRNFDRVGHRYRLEPLPTRINSTGYISASCQTAAGNSLVNPSMLR